MAAGIYVHIPFCKKKCNYCDFVSGCGTREDMDLYHLAILNEIESTDIFESVDSIFFGGGTPSVYPTEYIGEILNKIYQKYSMDTNLEVTIECNPGTIDIHKLKKYKEYGINRLSIGLQSAKDSELKELGRIHSFDDFLDGYRAARKVGFDNINIDLMSALPKQTVDSYRENLKKIIALNPEHISAYSLIIEEGTPFFELYNEKNGTKFNELPDEASEREMYYLSKEVLKNNGYERYEISNYSKEGYQCKHNLKYWSRDNYYGFGVAAASLVNDLRYTNISDRKKYSLEKGNINNIREEKIELTENDKIEEFMFLGLRKIKGISISEFENIFSKNINDIYGSVIKKLINEGCLEYDFKKQYLRLTDRGIDISNIVLAEFILI